MLQLNDYNYWRLFKTFDSFVLPTRGEGWGLPIMEAMAMEMPTIATNWSGPSEYLTIENSFPINVDKVLDNYAEPSLSHLKNLMRFVFNHREEANSRGKQARRDVISHYSEEVVSELVLKRLKYIEKQINIVK